MAQYLRHSTGSRFAAFRAGKNPARKAIPASSISVTDATSGEIVGVPMNSSIGMKLSSATTPHEQKKPKTAPIPSIRNV